MLDGHAVERAQEFEVDVRAGGVEDQEEPVPVVGEHQVVDHSAAVGGQQAVALAALFEPRDAGGDERLQGRGRVGHLPGLRADQ
nr:hypothetical protein [Tessaracoccus massiliensis]